MRSTFKVLFYTKNQSVKNGKAPIMGRITVNGTQAGFLTRQNLLDKLWRYDFYGDERVVDTHIKNLRKKLGIDFIQTIRGVGYKVDKEN